MSPQMQALVFSFNIVMGIFILIDCANIHATRAFRLNAIILYGLFALFNFGLFFFFWNYWRLAGGILFTTICLLDIVISSKIPKTKK